MLLVVQLLVTSQVAPSKTHHLYCCCADPPVTVAVNVMAVPVRCGATRFAVRLANVSGAT